MVRTAQIRPSAATCPADVRNLQRGLETIVMSSLILSPRKKSRLAFACAYLAIASQIQQASAFDITVRGDGKVELAVDNNEIKVNVVPPELQIPIRILDGEQTGEAIDNTLKTQVENLQTASEYPQLGNLPENAIAEALRKTFGEDSADIFQLSTLPNQYIRYLPEQIVRQATASKPADLKQIGGVPLAAALEHARDFYSGKAQPIPNEVKALLVRNFSPELLNWAQFAIDQFGGTVPAVINQFQEMLGNTHAVTVDNIVVFSQNPGLENIWFWAHELQHAEQYRALGISGFAAEYTSNYQRLEDEANKKADQAANDAEEIGKLLAQLAELNK
jgi:hypothetical protein